MKTPVWIALLLMIAALHAQDDKQTQAARHFRVAQAAMTAKDYAVAVEELLKCVELIPANALAHYNLAVALSEQQKYADALASLKRAQELGLPESLKEDSETLLATLTYRTRAKGSTAAPAAGDDNGPSLEETMAYLIKKINAAEFEFNRFASSSTSDGDIVYNFMYSLNASASGCEIRKAETQTIFINMLLRMQAVRRRATELWTNHWDLRYPLKDLNPDKVKVEERFPLVNVKADLDPEARAWAVLVRGSSDSKAITGEFTQTKKETFEDEISPATITRTQVADSSGQTLFRDKDSAESVAAAFRRAIKLCGGKSDPF